MIHGLVVMNPDHFTVKGNDPAGLKKLLLFGKANKGSRAEQGIRTIPASCVPVLRDEPVLIPCPIRENTTPDGKFPRIPDTSFEEIQQQWK